MHPEQVDALVDAARTGGDWAFERLWVELAPSVDGYLRGRGIVDHEDVTSEVFLAVFRQIASFDGNGAAFRSWVFTIAHHKSVDAIRALTRSAQSAGLAGDLDIATTKSAESAALELVGDSEIAELLQLMSPDQADVMMLRILGGLTVNEVAQTLGKSVGSVKQLQRRAINQLRPLVERQQREREESLQPPVPLSVPPTIAPVK